ncbi:MAG TPA: HipA N-terminal domain-containing protein [Ignavibacteriales bacterium]|nr:HipA N-terminal domain-containing protein [Ignavibacteriales bacterium]
MGRSAQVFYNSILAGKLVQGDNGFIFEYEDNYFQNTSLPAISLTLPKTERIYKSDFLFPFFYGLLSEGENKEIQCRMLNIDENDHFTLLLKTAHSNTIGGITIREVL